MSSGERFWRRLGLAGLIVVLLSACGERILPARLVPTTLEAPAWAAPTQLGDTGSAFLAGGAASGGLLQAGPLELTVDAAGNAFLAFAYGIVERGSSQHEARGIVHRAGQGWGTVLRLSDGTGVQNDWPEGVGLTPNGALFGWFQTPPKPADSQLIGLRGYDLQTGALSPGILLDAGSVVIVGILTDSAGVPNVVYRDETGTWLVRHTGVLQDPEVVFDDAPAAAVAADGSGALALATLDGHLAVRDSHGQWSRTRILAQEGEVSDTVLAGLPAGGFVVVWIRARQGALSYLTARLDTGGSLGSRMPIETVEPPPWDPQYGDEYSPRPKLAVGAGGEVAVAWQVGSQLYVTREIESIPVLLRPIPVVGHQPLSRKGQPFDLALDRSGRLLVAWTHSEQELDSAQAVPGEDWSPASRLATADLASHLLLAMNADGVAFLVWRELEQAMATRVALR